MSFGDFIKKMRSEQGLSQRELADKSGVSNAEISRMETGDRKKPSPNSIKAIAPFLGISYEELMVKAGYIEHVIDHKSFDEHIFVESDGTFVDTYRKAKRIAERDEELISILDRAVIKSSTEDIDTLKKILSSFVNDGLSESDKVILRGLLEKFSK
ncbi:MAG: helix-turn-helix domain-containing protein [Deltaproteobacteria bacterium]